MSEDLDHTFALKGAHTRNAWANARQPRRQRGSFYGGFGGLIQERSLFAHPAPHREAGEWLRRSERTVGERFGVGVHSVPQRDRALQVGYAAQFERNARNCFQFGSFGPQATRISGTRFSR